jgi:hypothetical protein
MNGRCRRDRKEIVPAYSKLNLLSPVGIGEVDIHQFPGGVIAGDSCIQPKALRNGVGAAKNPGYGVREQILPEIAKKLTGVPEHRFGLGKVENPSPEADLVPVQPRSRFGTRAGPEV